MKVEGGVWKGSDAWRRWAPLEKQRPSLCSGTRQKEPRRQLDPEGENWKDPHTPVVCTDQHQLGGLLGVDAETLLGHQVAEVSSI